MNENATNDPIATLSAALKNNFPKVFAEPTSPLKLGIDKDILHRHPEMDKAVLSLFLSRWVARSRYLLSTALGRPRLDLDGQKTGSPAKRDMIDAAYTYAWRHGIDPAAFDPRRHHPDYRKAQTVLHGNSLDTPIATETRDFLLRLLENHPDAADKLSAPVAAIVIHQKFGSTRTFFLVDENGTEISFSVLKCIAPDRPVKLLALPKTGPVKATLRHAASEIEISLTICNPSSPPARALSQATIEMNGPAGRFFVRQPSGLTEAIEQAGANLQNGRIRITGRLIGNNLLDSPVANVVVKASKPVVPA